MIVASEGGEIIPAEGAGTGYLESLEGGSEYTFSFQMKASDGLEEKSYKLTITNEYDDRYGEPYTVTDVIYLPVSIEQRAEITGVYAESDVVLGDSIEIMGNVSNLGTSILYNVKARVKADFVAESDTYIGNIEPGKNGSIDILTNTIHTTAANGEPGSIIVTYEDKAGNVTTLEDTFILSVEAPVYTDIEKVKDTTKKDYSKTIGISIAGGVIVVLIVVLAVKRRKRKKSDFGGILNGLDESSVFDEHEKKKNQNPAYGTGRRDWRHFRCNASCNRHRCESGNDKHDGRQ